MCDFEYVAYNVIRGELYAYEKFSSLEDALMKTSLISKKYSVELQLWKHAKDPRFSLCTSAIFDIKNGAMMPIF